MLCVICECSIVRGVENDLEICDACLEEEEAWQYEDDGQPDEMQEWHDFDPDCQIDVTPYPIQTQGGGGCPRSGKPLLHIDLQLFLFLFNLIQDYY